MEYLKSRWVFIYQSGKTSNLSSSYLRRIRSNIFLFFYNLNAAVCFIHTPSLDNHLFSKVKYILLYCWKSTRSLCEFFRTAGIACVTTQSGIASTACVMTQGRIASTACVYPQVNFLQVFLTEP